MTVITQLMFLSVLNGGSLASKLLFNNPKIIGLEAIHLSLRTEIRNMEAVWNGESSSYKWSVCLLGNAFRRFPSSFLFFLLLMASHWLESSIRHQQIKENWERMMMNRLHFLFIFLFIPDGGNHILLKETIVWWLALLRECHMAPPNVSFIRENMPPSE